MRLATIRRNPERDARGLGRRSRYGKIFGTPIAASIVPMAFALSGFETNISYGALPGASNASCMAVFSGSFGF